VTVYELTERGRALDGVLRALAQWGASTLGGPDPGDCWSMYAVHGRFRPEHAVDGVYEIRFTDGETFSLHVRDGELVAMRLSSENPTLVVEAEAEALHGVIEGLVDPRTAIAEGRLTLLVGTQHELAQLIAMFAPGEDAAIAAA
jgi:hypothetical protein